MTEAEREQLIANIQELAERLEIESITYNVLKEHAEEIAVALDEVAKKYAS